MHDHQTPRTTSAVDVPSARAGNRTHEPALRPGGTLRPAPTPVAEDARAGLAHGRPHSARTLGPKQAAGHLGIRSRDLDCLVEAGLLIARNERDGETLAFAVEDLERVATRADLDWPSVRGIARSSPSPWRILAGPVGERTAMVRELVARLRAEGVDAWARYSFKADCWTVDWTPGPDGPHRSDVVTSLPDRLVRAVLAHRLVVLGPVGKITHWANEMLKPGRAVVVDTETTGLEYSARVVEIAAVDASSGEILLNTLVNPQMPIPRRAQRIHGITDEMVAHAPTWDQVLPRLIATTHGRRTLAYNSDFDHGTVTRNSRELGLAVGPLARPDAWGCVMRARSTWLGTTSFLRLAGGHRALGDALAALNVLTQLAQRPPWTHEFDDVEEHPN